MYKKSVLLAVRSFYLGTVIANHTYICYIDNRKTFGNEVLKMSADFYGFADFGELDPAANTALMAFMIVYLIMMVFALCYSVVVYVLQSAGMYTIAKRRGIHHSWLAWIPIGSMWVLGSISDQYQFVAKGKIRNRRRVLLWLMVAVYALLLAFFVVFFATVFNSIANSAAEPSAAVVVTMIGTFGIYMVAWVLSVIAMVFMYIAYYDLFASCNPNNAVLFLVLSIFFNFLLPFFVFACRKKDEGMPPRKVQIPVAPWTPASEAPAPVWQPPVAPTPVPAAPVDVPTPAEEEKPAEEEVPTQQTTEQ